MTTTIGTGRRSDRQDHASGSPAALPPGVEYHRAFAGERRRVLRGLLTIVLLLVGMVGFGRLFIVAAGAVDENLLGRTGFTPLQQAAGALSLAVMIPYSMLLQRILYGVPVASLHSVTGRFRYDVLGRALLWFAPVVAVAVAVPALVEGERIPWSTADLVALVAVSVLLTPLAAAGEEYGFRGLMFRVVGGWTRGARAGAVLGVVLTTIFFSLLHGTLDPYLLTSYLVLFSSLAVVTWRTGGLEVAVVLHAVYNAMAFLLAIALHVDLGGEMGSRGEAVGSAANLVPSAALVLVTAAVWWSTRRSGPVRA